MPDSVADSRISFSISDQSHVEPLGLYGEIKATRMDNPVTDSIPDASKLWWNEFKQLIYPHFIIDHLDYESFKVIFRNWVLLWSMLILTIVETTNNWLGPSSFIINFGGVVEMNGGISVSNAVLISSLNTAYTAYGVLGATIANAITWRLRGYPTEAQTFQTIYESGRCAMGDKECVTALIYAGEFLETRCTLIHIFAQLFCLATASYLSVKNRLFASPWILLSLTFDSAVTSTALLPYFDPWKAGRSVVLPIGLASAARVLCAVIIYPTSSTAKFLKSIGKTLKATDNIARQFLEAQRELRPAHPLYESQVFQHFLNMDKVLQGEQDLELDKILSRWEIVYAKFDTQDLANLRKRVFKIGNAFHGFTFFHNEFRDRQESIAKLGTNRHGPGESSLLYRAKSIAVKRGEREYGPVGTFEEQNQRTYNEWMREDIAENSMTLEALDEIYVGILTGYQDLMQASVVTMTCISNWLDASGQYGIFSFLWQAYYLNAHTKCEKATAELKAALMSLKVLDREDISSKILRKFDHLKPGQKEYLLEQGAYVDFICHQFVKSIIRLAQVCLNLESRYPKPRWITPSNNKGVKLRSGGARDLSLEGVGDLDAMNDDIVRFRPLTRVQKRDPDSSSPQHWYHFAGLRILMIYHFLCSPDFTFAVKRAVLTLIGLSLSYFRTTAKLYFSHRVGWDSAMIALTVSQNAADGIYGFMTRLAFSFIGCTAGMVAWYIPSGSGSGNPYGYAAVMAVLFLYLSFHRQYANHRTSIAGVVLGISVVIVAGASWVGKHNPSPYVELAPGFETAWVRFVCVAAGLSIGFVGTIFPRPSTAKTSIRNVLAAVFTQITDLQSHVLNFSMQRYETPSIHADTEKDLIDLKISNLFTKVRVAERLTVVARFEPPLGGKWPEEKYSLLIRIQKELVNLYWLTYLVVDGLSDTSEIPSLLRRLGWASADITQSVYSLLYMVSRALASGEPLPMVSPGYLSVMHLNLLKKIHKSGNMSAQTDNIRYHEDEPLLISMITARMIYERLDGVMLLVKSLVGENFDTDTRAYDFADLESADDLVRTSSSNEEKSLLGHGGS